ncbi:hypothetical protein FKM82_016694 [Ascaphus truei]|uniref:promotilin n=1 Tax=Ascaphus truei TaxID=8439 RepID=UPI003F5A1F13
MASRAAVSTLLVIYGLCMLAEKTRGLQPFFSHSQAREMQKEWERNKALKKSVQQRSEGGELRGLGGLEEDVIRLRAPVEFEMRLDSRQMETYRDILENLLNEGPVKP